MNEKTILQRFDSARFGKFHILLILLTGSCFIWAAYGVTVVGFMLPSLKSEWNLSAGTFGILASTAMAGMLAGSVVAGNLSDRFGRRRMLTLIMFFLGLLFTISAFAGNIYILLVLRFITGMGMGAILPVAGALVTELSPAKLRGTILVIVNGFWGVGGTIAALVGYGLILHNGWRPAMLLGALSIVSGLLIHWLLPESMRFLLGKGQLEEAVKESNRVHLEQDATVLAVASTAPVPEVVESGANTRNGIWSAGFARITFSLWVMWFGMNFLYQGVYLWLPTLLAGSVNSNSQSFLMTLFISLGQMPGTILVTYLADRTSRLRLIISSLLLLGAAALLFGLSQNNAWVLTIGFLLMVFNGMSFGIAYPFSSELYPTRIRGAANGWASGVGRLGGVAAPLFLGVIIQAGFGLPVIFSILGAAPLLAVLVLSGLKHDTTGRTLEEISGE